MGRALLIALALLSGPGPFTLVNGTGLPLMELSLRATNTTASWRPLAPALSPGARTAAPAAGGEDCAFDIRARTGAGTLTWSGVNLCDVRVVTLNQGRDGTLWIDYD